MVAYRLHRLHVLLGESSLFFKIRCGRGIGRAAAKHKPRQKSAAQMNQTVTMSVISIRDWRLQVVFEQEGLLGRGNFGFHTFGCRSAALCGVAAREVL